MKDQKPKFGIIVHEITPNSEDLFKEIKKRGHFVDYLYFKKIIIAKNQLKVLFDKIGDWDILLWRDTQTPAVIRKIIATYFLAQKKIFIDKVWATRDWTANKLRQVEFFTNYHLSCPRTLFLNFSNQSEQFLSKGYQQITSSLGLPFIIKPLISSKGRDIFLVKNEEDFREIKDKLVNYDFLFQEFIPNDGDFRALVIGGKFIGAYKRVPKKGEFRANIAQGGKGEKIKPDNKLAKLSETVAKIIGIEILGVDIIKSQKNNLWYLLETNGTPQWQGFKKTTGINVAKKIIDYALSLYQKS